MNCITDTKSPLSVKLKPDVELRCYISSSPTKRTQKFCHTKRFRFFAWNWL